MYTSGQSTPTFVFPIAFTKHYIGLTNYQDTENETSIQIQNMSIYNRTLTQAQTRTSQSGNQAKVLFAIGT